MPNDNKLTSEAREKVLDEIENRVYEAKRVAKNKVPVDTGYLKSRIQVVEKDYGWFLGADVDYAPFVEFGTEKMMAQPFLRPAAHQAMNKDSSP